VRREDTLVDRFIRRLSKIGIEVELNGNFPWIYLDKVNGVKVKETYLGDRGFTAFFLPVKIDRCTSFSDRAHVFQKIREMRESGGER
jgi:hypothetical protein